MNFKPTSVVEAGVSSPKSTPVCEGEGRHVSGCNRFKCGLFRCGRQVCAAVGAEKRQEGERKAHGIARGSSSSTSVAPLHDPASATFLNRTHCLRLCHSDNDAALAQLTGTRWRFAARASTSGPGVAGAFRFESRSIRMQIAVASIAAGLQNDQHEKEAAPDDARCVVAFCRWVGSGWCCVPGLWGPHLKCRAAKGFSEYGLDQATLSQPQAY